MIIHCTAPLLFSFNFKLVWLKHIFVGTCMPSVAASNMTDFCRYAQVCELSSLLDKKVSFEYYCITRREYDAMLSFTLVSESRGTTLLHLPVCNRSDLHTASLIN